jgi:hypothetical protein
VFKNHPVYFVHRNIFFAFQLFAMMGVIQYSLKQIMCCGAKQKFTVNIS